jgi:hypothetical protein
MKHSKLLFGAFLLLTIYGCSNEDQGIDSRFHGTWKLDKIESLDNVTGKWAYDSAFAGWIGFILYDGMGHMSAQITPKGYRDFDVSKNIDSLGMNDLKELVKLYKSNFVYVANYKISDGTIDHERLSATNPTDWGTVITRDFEFRNDTLVLTPHEFVWGKKTRLWWVKL